MTDATSAPRCFTPTQQAVDALPDLFHALRNLADVAARIERSQVSWLGDGVRTELALALGDAREALHKAAGR